MATAEQELLNMIVTGLSDAGIPLNQAQIDWLNANEGRIPSALRKGDKPFERRIPYTLNRTGEEGFITGQSKTLVGESTFEKPDGEVMPIKVYKVAAIWRKADGTGGPINIDDVDVDLTVGAVA